MRDHSCTTKVDGLRGERMPTGKMSDEDRKRLSDHFWAIVLSACDKHDCWPGEVLNRCRKSHGIKGISPARAEIVKEMRRTAFTYYHEGKCLLHFVEQPDEPHVIPLSKSGNEATPISFPLLSRMLGFDHSTLVVAQQRLMKLKENDHALA